MPSRAARVAILGLVLTFLCLRGRPSGSTAPERVTTARSCPAKHHHAEPVPTRVGGSSVVDEYDDEDDLCAKEERCAGDPACPFQEAGICHRDASVRRAQRLMGSKGSEDGRRNHTAGN